MKNLRGNTLLIIMIVSLLIAASAATVFVISGETRINAIRNEGGNVADANAFSGMHRAIAALDEFANAGELDLDLALDRTLVSGAGLATCPPDGDAAEAYPIWSDGTLQVFQGRNYLKVPYNGGAYMVRFDDDDDDGELNDNLEALLAGSTSNHGCPEGPILPIDVDDERDVPDRDRNGAVYITAVGISPGTNPDTAVNVRVIRQLYTRGPIPVGGIRGIEMDGTIETKGTSQFLGCSPIAGVHLTGHLHGNGSGPRSCLPGVSEVDNAHPGDGIWDHCQANSTSPKACPDFGLTPSPGTITEVGITVPTVDTLDSAAGTDKYMDLTSPCNFWLDHEDDGNGVWFWDAHANRGPGGVLCSSISGEKISNLLPNLNVDDWNRCWTPLVVTMDGTNTWSLTLGGGGDDDDATPSVTQSVPESFSPWGDSSMPDQIRALADEDCHREFAYDIDGPGVGNVTGSSDPLAGEDPLETILATNRARRPVATADAGGGVKGVRLPDGTVATNIGGLNATNRALSTGGGASGSGGSAGGGWCPIGGVAFPVPVTVDTNIDDNAANGDPLLRNLVSMDDTVTAPNRQVDDLGGDDFFALLANPQTITVNGVDIKYGERTIDYGGAGPHGAQNQVIRAGESTIVMHTGQDAGKNFINILAALELAGTRRNTTFNDASISGTGAEEFAFFTKPDWSAECTLAYPPVDFVDPRTANAPVGTQLRACSNCDGNNRVLFRVDTGGVTELFPDFHAGNVTADPARDERSGRRRNRNDTAGTVVSTSQKRLHAAPAGFYYYSHGHSIESKNSFPWDPAIAPAAGDDDVSKYPLMTFGTTGIIDFQAGGSTTPSWWFGVGTSGEKSNVPTLDLSAGGLGGLDTFAGHGPELIVPIDPSTQAFYPSFVTDGNVDLQGGAVSNVLGSFYVNGTFSWNGNGDMFHFGEIHAKGDMNLGGSGAYVWQYQIPLSPPLTINTRGSLAPTMSRSN